MNSWTLDLLSSPVPNPHQWRDFTPDKRIPVRHKLQFADLIPLCTDGLIAQCRVMGQETIITVQLSNLEWPKAERVIRCPSPKPKKQKKELELLVEL